MSYKKQLVFLILGFIAWVAYGVMMVIFLGDWVVGSTVRAVVLTLLIFAPGVPLWLFSKRWNKRRAIRQVVRIFKKYNAIGVENAKTAGQLGISPPGPLVESAALLADLVTRTGSATENINVRQDALDSLIQDSIVKSTSDGRLYLAVVPCENCGHNNPPNTLSCAKCDATLVTRVQQAVPVEELPRYEAMKRAGACNIVSSAFIVAVGVIWLVIPVVGNYVWAKRGYGGRLELESLLLGLLTIIYGLLVLVSGILARRGERWGLALIGSILSLPVPFAGAIAIISLIQARYEWPNVIRWLAYVVLSIVGLGILAVWVLLAGI